MTDILLSEVQGDIADIRLSALQNPLVWLFKKNEIVDTVQGALSFSRESSATYINRYGVMKVAEADVPRQEKEGWLIEGESTNLVKEVGGWTPTRVSITPNTLETLSPDGNNGATKVETLGDIDPFLVGGIALVGESLANRIFTYSIWVWCPSGVTTEAELFLYQNTSGTGGSSYSKKIIPTTTPTRYELTRTFYDGDTGHTATVRIDSHHSGAIGNTIYVWGAQVEELPFATSYIPTVDTPVSRAADLVSIPAIDNRIANGESFSIAVKASTNKHSNNQMVFTTGGADYLLWRYQNAGSYAARLRGEDEVIRPIAGAGVGENLVSLVSTYSRETDTLALFSDSVKREFRNHGGSIFSRDAGFVVGNSTDGLSPIYGHLQDFMIYDFALNASEIKFLSGE